MFVRNAPSSSRSFARHFALFAIAASAVNCEGQPVSSSSFRQHTLGSGDQRSTNAVLRWNEFGSDFIVQVGPVMDSRAFAIFHVAIHDAVNAVAPRYATYTMRERAPSETSLDAAVAGAAREVLLTFAPTQRDKIDREYAEALALVPDGAAKDRGVSFGRRAATAILARRADDGVPVGPWPPQSGPITQPVYVPSGKPGDYAFTPPFDQPPLGPLALFPGWGALKPFAVDLANHSLPGPDPLGSERYARDLDSVRVLGSLTSNVRTDDQTQIAFFWFEPFPTWSEIAREALIQRGADVWEAARTLALMHLAVADAGIACFEAKYRFRFWRPFTAIRGAAEDGNPATHPDPEWLPLLWPSSDSGPPTFLIPPIPDYPSAAATVAAAAAAVLRDRLGDDISVEVTSPWLPGVTRRFTSFSRAAHENAMSRVFGGIHFLRAVHDGSWLGERVARDVSRLLPPVGGSRD